MNESVKAMPMGPDETLELANAMALRSGRMESMLDQIQAELSGVPYVETLPEDLRQKHIGRVSLYLSQVDNPGAPVKLANIMDALRGDKGYDIQAAVMEQDTGIAVEAEGLRKVSHSAADAVQQSSGLTDVKMGEDFAKTLTAAKEVAEQKGVPVAQVYESDEYYFEALKLAESIEEAATDLCNFIEGYTPEIISGSIMQNLASLMPKELLEELGDDEVSTIMNLLQGDDGMDEVHRVIEEQVETTKEAFRQYSMYYLVKSYGIEGLNTLPPAQRIVLMPRRPLTKVIAERLS